MQQQYVSPLHVMTCKSTQRDVNCACCYQDVELDDYQVQLQILMEIALIHEACRRFIRVSFAIVSGVEEQTFKWCKEWSACLEKAV